MGANLITWSGQTVTPQYDALVFGLFAPDGIIYGVDITQSASDPNIINISNGYGIIQGRFFTIEEFSVNVELTTGATYQGQLILHMDLSNADEPISVVVDTGATIRSLIKDADVNIVNGIYEMQLCTFTVDAAAVTDIAITYPEAIKYSFDSIAESEISPALKNHSIGDYIAYNGKLYRVTTAITAGSTLDGKIAERSVSSCFVKTKSFTGRTNSMGLIEGSTSDLFGVEGATVLSAYLERGSYGIRRSVEIQAYGNAGYGFICKDGGTAINAKSVTIKVAYVD